MNLSLTTWQRLMCIQALNVQSGHISMLRKALRLLEVLELTVEEQQQIGLVTQAGGGMFWQDTERRFELEICPEGNRELAAFLKRAVASYQEWPVNQSAQVVDLFERLGIEKDPSDGGPPDTCPPGTA